MAHSPGGSGFQIGSDGYHTSSYSSSDMGPSPTLTIRMIMQGKEVGNIIGKKGENIKQIREESGAKINISDNKCPERIVTVTGHTDAIYKAFSLVCKRFEEAEFNQSVGAAPKPPVTLRLIVPASQCGSLIGKGGSKIREIREVTGASVQVASEMLPGSTERAVTISGTAEAITQCVYHICCVMLESPPKGPTMPYRPKPGGPEVAGMNPLVMGGMGMQGAGMGGLSGRGALGGGGLDLSNLAQLQQLAQLLQLLQGGGLGGSLGGGQSSGTQANTLQALMSALGPTANPQSQMGGRNREREHDSIDAGAGGGKHERDTQEITVPNDVIGCIIGRGGSKINEIRQLSGAMIRIAPKEDSQEDRPISITGTHDQIQAATYLINTSVELHKQGQQLDTTSASALLGMMGGGGLGGGLMGNNPLSALLKPSPLMGGLSGSGNLFDLAAGLQQRNLQTKIRGSGGGGSNNDGEMKKRDKFAPY